MVFAKACRLSMYPDFQEAGGYVDYQRLKGILHRMKEDAHSATRATEKELFEVLRDEIRKVHEWCLRKVQEITEMAQSAIERKESAPRGGLKAMADSILHTTLRFVECRNLNTDIINRIVLRHHRYTALSPSNKWLSINEGVDFQRIQLDEVYYLISILYSCARDEEQGVNRSQGMPTGAMASQVFDRRSVKYWVHRQDLPFVIARIIQHLPLSTIKDTYTEAKQEGIPFRLGQQISSVYYDTEQFLCYHRRLERLEGSSLLRIRWYGDQREKDINKLNPDDDVYCELKVHHEAWSGERSTKRRFALKAKDVDTFFEGNLNLDPAVEKLKAKGTPIKEIKKFQSLAHEVLNKFEAYNMKPVLRTQYVRSAFQRGTDATIRVSIDENLRMTAEDFGMGRHWRYEGIDELAHIDFPYSVVEVKLMSSENERIPAWIEELMQCRYMEAIPKFSKFGHGIAALFGHTPRVKMVPYWLHQIGVDIRAVTKPESNKWDPTAGLAVGCLERAADRAIFGQKDPQNPHVGANQAPFLPNAGMYNDTYKRLKRTLKGHVERAVGGQSPPANADLIVPEPPAVDQDVVYSLERRYYNYIAKNVYNYGQGGTEAICAMVPTVSAANIGEGVIPWQIRKRVQVPQRFDPKTLLTGERYFLKWVDAATKLGIAGIAIIRFGGSGLMFDGPQSSARRQQFSYWWRQHFHATVGVLMVVLGVITAVYAAMVFHARSRRVYARRKIRYDDVMGPTALTFVVVFALCAVALNHILLRFGPMLTGDGDL